MAGVLDGQVAIVTGGSRGIGRAISIELAKQGATIAVNYHSNADAANAVVSEIEAGGGKAKAYQADVSDYDQSKAMVEQIIADLGPVRILINNAGATADRTLARMTPEEWRKPIATNVDSLYNMTSSVWRSMGEAGGGHVVNLSSIVGQTGRVGLVNYGTSKAAAIGFTRAAAREGARTKIQVNAVAPGFIDTDMLSSLDEEARKRLEGETLIGRLGNAQEIAAVVRFIVCEGTYMTGAVLDVNGGMFIG